jgi:arylsulfatase A-like enzyme
MFRLPKSVPDEGPSVFRVNPVILFLAALCALAMLLVSCGEQDPLDLSGFNVILISLDTLRADHLHAYGYEKALSPAISTMAADGVLFEHVYAQSNWTLPSHVSMLTGLYPAGHGVNNPKTLIPRDVPLLSEMLQQHGYHTASFNAGGYVSHRFGFKRGYDLYREIERQDGDIRTISDELFLWLRENKDEKFFAFFHTYEIHHPYDPPDSFREDLKRDDDYVNEKTAYLFKKIVEGGDLMPEDYGFLWLLVHSKQRPLLKKAFIKFCQDYRDSGRPGIDCQERTTRVKQLAARLFDEEESIFEWYRSVRQRPVETFSPIDYMVSHYDREIQYTDQQIARLLALLDELGLREKTLILLTSDHGEEFVEHGRWGHRRKCHHYDETIRVPLILHCRGRLPAGRRISANTALVDIVPTILYLVGLPPAGRGDGISLAPLMAGAQAPRRALFSESRHEKYGIWSVTVIEDRWKYHYDMARTMPDELYDTGADPGEEINLLAQNEAVPPSLKEAADRYERRISGLADQEEATLDDELREQLKDLGYFE